MRHLHYVACLVCTILLLCCGAPAQTGVRLQNHGTFPYSGWLRATVDVDPGVAGPVGGDVAGRWVRGRQIGRDAWAVDLLVDLPAGAARLAKLLPGDKTAPPPALPVGPADPLAHFGGPVVVAGVVASIVELQTDGAALTAHLRARHGRTLVTDVWIAWYPGQAWAEGEVLTVSSNPAVPDVTEAAGPITVRFGDAVTVLGGSVRDRVAEAETWADAQGRAVPVLFVWPRLLTRGSDWSSVGALADAKVGRVGITRAWPAGNPRLPADWDAIGWAVRTYEPARKALSTWDAPPIGPAANSGQTGAQEDQVFVRTEPLRLVGAEIPILWSALAMAKRPCQHREPDGSMLDPAKHVEPRLILWDSRPHWHTGVSPDRLGKPRAATNAETRGWSGPDVEHQLVNTLALAHRFHGSRACDYLLQQQATNYPLQWTTTPGWSTSQPYAARAVGWEALLVVHLDRELEDRALAARVVAHWRARVRDVIVPQLRARGDWWDVRRDDPRLGAGDWAIAWQQAAGGYFLQWAGKLLGEPGAIDLGQRACQVVVDRAWREDATAWRPSPQLPVVGTAPIDDSFRYFGMALAPAALPNDARSQRLMAWLIAQAKSSGDYAWLAPEAFPR